MSYVLQNRVHAFGVATLTVPAGGSLTSLNVSVASIQATDTLLISVNQNAQTSVAINTAPYTYTITAGTGFSVGMELENGDPGAAAECLLNWAVLR